MSVVVVVRDLEEPANVVMAADTQALDAGLIFRQQKIFRWSDEVIFGVVGDVGFIPVMWKVMRAPSEDLSKWAQKLACRMTKLAIERQLVNADAQLSGSVVVAVRDRVWLLDMFTSEEIDEWLAIGAGREVAMGALEILLDFEDPAFAANRAVEVTCKHQVQCGLPVDLLFTSVSA